MRACQSVFGEDELGQRQGQAGRDRDRQQPGGLARDRGERPDRKHEGPDQPPEGGVGAGSRLWRRVRLRHQGAARSPSSAFSISCARISAGVVAGAVMSGSPSIFTPFHSRLSAMAWWYAEIALR